MTNPVSIVNRPDHDDYFHEGNLLRRGISHNLFWDAYQDSLVRFPRFRTWFIKLQFDPLSERPDGTIGASWRFVVPL